MLSQLTCVLMSFLLIVSSVAMGAECLNPFPNSSSFYLTEQLTCKDQTTYTLHISQDTNSFDKSLPYLSPACDDNGLLGFTLYDGKIKQAGKTYDFIVSFTLPSSPSQTQLLKVVQTCNGQTAFRINTEPQEITLDGRLIDVDYTVLADDESGSIVAMVRSMDNTINSLTLTAPDGTVLGSAHKTFAQDKGESCGHAYWTVTPASGLDPSMMAYLLMLKDNEDATCHAKSNSPSFSAGKWIVAGMISAAFIAGATGLGVYLYCAKKNGSGPYHKSGRDLAI